MNVRTWALSKTFMLLSILFAYSTIKKFSIKQWTQGASGTDSDVSFRVWGLSLKFETRVFL